VNEVWRIGGAQAIGALAYGTQRIKPVDVVVGPGNAWVAEAKRQLYGVVGIDMVAGPSEILLIADGQNDPEWAAADLLSQAEHDPSAQSIMITDDPVFADTVADRIGVELAMLPSARVASESWKNHGVIIEVASLDEAPALANALAAEHVQLSVEAPDKLFKQIRHAGSVFLGRMTPEAVGDYVAGPNHVLPTGRRARFSSGLSVLDFMKRTSFIQLDEAALKAIGPAAIHLAEAEGLPAHARSIEVRLGI
jgi:histidinol dehydrogenase